MNIEALKNFLENSNVNLGRKSDRRAEFVAEVLRLACSESLLDVNDTELGAKPSTDKVMKLKKSPRNTMIKKGAAIMTESDSMKADEELGNSQF